MHKKILCFYIPFNGIQGFYYVKMQDSTVIATNHCFLILMHTFVFSIKLARYIY